MRPPPMRAVCYLLASAVLLTGCSPSLRLNVVYNCGPSGEKVKILSCTGETDDSLCDVQPYKQSDPRPRTQSTRKALLTSLRNCLPQDRSKPASSPSLKPGAALKPGDALEIFLFGE